MQTWTDFERTQQMALHREEMRDLECITCKSCGSQFFEEVKASRYLLNHHLIVGQNVPPKAGSVPYVLLRCLRCGELLEPRVMQNARDLGAKDYEKFIDTMKGQGDTRKEQKVQDEILNEEL